MKSTCAESCSVSEERDFLCSVGLISIIPLGVSSEVLHMNK